MKALITGASSGLGRAMALELDRRGYALILVARRTDKLEALAAELQQPPRLITMDIAGAAQAQALHTAVREEDIDLLINNAGFGVWGRFTETDLEREQQMIALNIETLHVLTKLFLRDLCARGHGRILNVASAAAFAPGPLMAAYYAGKAYVLRLTQALAAELRQQGSAVTVSALCPGPVATEFNDVAEVHFSAKPLTADAVAAYAIRQTLRGKTVIVPGAKIKAARLLAKLSPDGLTARVTARIQANKKS